MAARDETTLLPRQLETGLLKPSLTQFRCPGCHALLARQSLGPGGVLEIKCPKCNRMCTLSVGA